MKSVTCFCHKIGDFLITFIFQLDSDKQAFGLDNVLKCDNIVVIIIKIQCFENLSDFLGTLNENISTLVCHNYKSDDSEEIHVMLVIMLEIM